MLERQTFIVRVNLPARRPIVEDVSTREQVQLPDLSSIADEIERRLDSAEVLAAAGPKAG